MAVLRTRCQSVLWSGCSQASGLTALPDCVCVGWCPLGTVDNLLSAALVFTLDLSSAERGLILALGLLVLAAELMNTGLEAVLDYISKQTDPRAKRAKDCGSVAVALTALAGGVAWAVIHPG